MFTRKKFGMFTKRRVVVFAFVVLAALGFPNTPLSGLPSALAQTQEGSNMEQRLAQLRRALEEGDCETVKTALDLITPDGTSANMRVVPTKGQEVTIGADRMLSDIEMKTAEVLKNFVLQGKCPQERGRALDLKLLLEQQNEVARAVAPFTNRCGEGDNTNQEPCNMLQPVLDEETGHEVHQPRPAGVVIRFGFSVKLRGPFIPPYIRQMQEDVRVTAPINPGQCVVIFKETKGLMLRLTFIRMTIVLDPWATPMLARGTRVPVWALQWVPAEHAKEWNICNIGGRIQKTVTQRVKQDIPLHYFWRYYPKDP